SFFDRLPGKVRICTDDFPRGRYVDAALLQKGDTFRVTADEALAGDGRVIAGAGSVDESALTGEARPIEKQAGDTVSSGTCLISGDMRVRATAVGENAMVGQLTAIMEKALSDKTAMEGATDRALRYFVPTIVLLAAATGSICLLAGFGVRESMIRAITVLVISCPCALGVAIPLARVAGISLAAKIGVLVHDFSAFEGIRKMGAYVFDKTGTLTRGRWEFLDVVPADGRRATSILSMAAGLESFSGHWVGRAIAFAAEQRHIGAAATPADATEYDNGIAGTIDGVSVKIGSARFVADVLGNIENRIDNSGVSEETAVSAVYMTIGDALAAVFYFGDRVRDSSEAVIAALRERGKTLCLISGDGSRTTAQIGGMLGISDCHGGMRPEEKAAFVKNLKQEGHRVVMVGDGVNDVPALASADLGIAVHGGHQIGNEASAVTLMGNDPKQILDFERLAGRVAKTIRQNLVFTFAYNAVAIPVAMSGLLNPLVAVTAMLLSSLSVTGNTLRLSVGGVPAHSQEERPAQFPGSELTKETA
ncbi:MAG: heavy metal translocating P-type ATPase, partial [Thermodesulfobacteriota bacterium]